MEAVFIALMALVVLTAGWLAIVVLHRLFRVDNRADQGADTGTSKH